MGLALGIEHQTWPIAGKFAISRGAKTSAEIIEVTLSDGQHCGRGECVPYGRYGESIESVTAQLESLRGALLNGVNEEELQSLLPAGAARNALDCAMWDFECKKSGESVWELIGVESYTPPLTAYTISVDTPEAMGQAAAKNAHRPLLKIKLAGEDDFGRDNDFECVEAVRKNAPDARLIVDANEAWSEGMFLKLCPGMALLGVELIEQPFPADEDDILANIPHPVPVCADESVHTREGLAELVGKYDVINIKLDKCGGLTEALFLRQEAQQLGFEIMVGCMVGTSLGMAPAVVLAQGVKFADLDGPLLLARDREYGLEYREGLIQKTDFRLWG